MIAPAYPGLAPVSRFVRVLFLLAGCVCVGLAVVGYLAPLVPATPFVLLASACFVRSSDKLHRWLLRAPVLGALLRDWEVRGGVTRRVKLLALVAAAGGAAFSLSSSLLSVEFKIVGGFLVAIGLVVILCLPVAR